MNEVTYVVSAHEIAWGMALVALSLIVHGAGMVSILRAGRWFYAGIDRYPTLAKDLVVLIVATCMIILVHFGEVIIWAAFFQWKHCFVNFSTALYFALTDYTTIGSNVSLPTDWRLLAGMIATAGLLGFAWSTAVLMTLAQTFQTHELQRMAAPHEPAGP